MPLTWKRALANGNLPHAADEQLATNAMSPDGKLVFAESDRPGGPHEFVMIDRGSGRRTIIQQYAASDTAAQILGAAFDGRYLVYTELRSTSDYDHWTLWLWDSAGGAPRQLATSMQHADGSAPPGPLTYPLIADGRAIWTRSSFDGTVDLDAYDIATGRRTTVRHGHPATPLLIGDDIVWPESDAPNTLTALSAVSATTLKPIALPPSLAAIRGPGFMAASNGTVAWTDPNLAHLYIWRSGWSQPWEAVTVGGGQAVQWLRIAGDLVTWDNQVAQFGLDLRTRRFVQLTPDAGATGAAGGYLMVEYAPTEKSNGRPPINTSIVNASVLPPL